MTEPADLFATAFRVGEWTVDPKLDTLTRGSERIKLEPKITCVLVYLAGHARQVVSSADIEAEVWKGLVVTSQSVYQSIAQLRRYLGDSAREPRYIVTVPRKGYQLIADVGPIAEAAGALAATRTPAQPPGFVQSLVASPTNPSHTPQGALSPPLSPAAASTLPSAQRAHRLLGLAGAALIVVGVAAFVWWRSLATSAEPPSIAVLPFADLSAAHDNAPFCDGLTDELTSSLGLLPQLRVIARDSTYAFREVPRDVKRIGTTLGVSHLLEGSVRHEGEHLRVTAALIDSRSGLQVWAKTFERSGHEMLHIQEDIARDVIRELKLELSPTSSERLAQRTATDVTAYERYLLGRYQQLQRTPAALERAVAYQNEALAQDPDFALAYAGLADAYMAGYYYQARPLAEVAPLVEKAVANALVRDPNLAEAYAARGVLRTEQMRLDEAVADLRRASVLKPNYAEALIRLGGALEYRGTPREALTAYDQALDLDPLHFVLHERRCLVLQNLGRYPLAKQACARAIELQPDNPNGYWTAALESFAAGDEAEAIRGYREALARAKWRTDLQSQLAWLERDVGLDEQGRNDADASIAQGGDHVSLAIDRAFIVAASGDAEQVRGVLRNLDLGASTDLQPLLDSALLELVAKDVPAAQALAARAQASAKAASDAEINGVWQTRWGRSGELTLALCALAAGDRATADRDLARVEGWLDYLQRNGHVWAGLHYLRAETDALRGRPTEAVRELDESVKLGWRRAWWMSIDPALEPLRNDARFKTLLTRIAAANESTRTQLSRQ